MSTMLYIDVEDVLIDTRCESEYVTYTSGCIHSLYQLNKQKGCSIHLLLSSSLRVNWREQLFALLASEGVDFITTNKDDANAVFHLMEKTSLTDLIISASTKFLMQEARGQARKVLFQTEANDEHFTTSVVSWLALVSFIMGGERKALVERNTSETQIKVEINLDSSAKARIQTGIGFFDHMLEQIARHANIALIIETSGDLHVDEHHTMEDTALALGEAFRRAVGDKRGMERYGFALPMDDCAAQVLIDFGGRPWLVWDATFTREKVGDMPTEMFLHFFKSFSDAAQVNLNIKAEGQNEHHKIEGIFKAFARAIRMAIRRDVFNMQLPSTKGML